MSANNQIILSCTGLGKRFTQGQDSLTVLENINFTVSKGERVAIVGVSGSGKSTLLHLLGGLDTPTSGSVTLQGQELNSLGRSISSTAYEPIGSILWDSKQKPCMLTSFVWAFLYIFCSGKCIVIAVSSLIDFLCSGPL